MIEIKIQTIGFDDFWDLQRAGKTVDARREGDALVSRPVIDWPSAEWVRRQN